MDRGLIVKRLDDTIDMMKKLKDGEFDYSSIVRDYDKQHNCGTVCCAAGWYPKYFPEAGIYWDDKEFHINLSGSELVRKLSEWHGLDINIIDIIFMGDFKDISVREDKLNDAMYVLLAKRQSITTSVRFGGYALTEMAISLTNRSLSSKEEVIDIFDTIRDMVSLDMLDESMYV